MSSRQFPSGAAGLQDTRTYNFVNKDGASGVQWGPNNVMTVHDAGPQGRHSGGERKAKVKKPKKPLSQSEREPNLDQMDKICKHIDKYKETAWMELGEKLGLTRGEVETVKHDYLHTGMYEMCYQMLATWKKRQPTKPQIKVLAQALCDIGRGDLSDTLADRVLNQTVIH